MELMWFYYFNNKDKNNLMSNFKDKISDENLIICQELSSRRYTVFKNPAYFYKFFSKSSFDENCFYEMMRPGINRKPYFDIDIEDDYEFDIEKMKTVIKNILGEKLKILVFTSHYRNKKSFHIVIDGVCFSEVWEMQSFYDEVVSQLPEKDKDYVDDSVYKSVQQFRILGSHKWSKENVKKLDENLSFNYSLPKRSTSEKAKFIHDLSISLVTNTERCEVIQKFKKPKIQKVNLGIGTASEDDLKDVMKMFYSKYSMNDFRFYECKENNGNLLIILRRLNATYCEDCERVHEHENPFIVTSGEFRNIYFYCRRNEKGKFLGSLGLPDLDISDNNIPRF